MFSDQWFERVEVVFLNNGLLGDLKLKFIYFVSKTMDFFKLCKFAITNNKKFQNFYILNKSRQNLE
jgi:hypothetical protein